MHTLYYMYSAVKNWRYKVKSMNYRPNKSNVSDLNRAQCYKPHV